MENFSGKNAVELEHQIKRDVREVVSKWMHMTVNNRKTDRPGTAQTAYSAIEGSPNRSTLNQSGPLRFGGTTSGVPPLSGLKTLSEKRMSDENKHLKSMGK